MLAPFSPSTTQPDLSLVLACYNEETVLEVSVQRIVQTLEASRCSWEIIFVEDASTDRTRELLHNILAARKDPRLRAIFHEHNAGRGQAVSDGIRAACGGVVGFIDVDLEVGPEFIIPCVQAIHDGADVALGKRVFKFSARGLWRYVLSTGYARLARGLLPLGSVTDSESGYKFFRREAALALLDRVRDPGWFWDTEIMCRAALGAYRIAEVPCLYLRNYRRPSTVHSVRDSFVYVRRVSAFRRMLRAEARNQSATAFWRDHAETFATHYGANSGPTKVVGRFLHQRTRIIDAWTVVAPGQRALDAGCGHGVYLTALAKQGAHVTGVDISPDMLAQARAALVGCADVDLVCASIESQDFPAESFDLVLAVGLLDYVADWVGVLRRLARWTKRGGRIVFTVPKRPSPYWFLRSGPGLVVRLKLLGLPPILVAVTRSQLETAVRELGLHIDELTSCQGTMWAVRVGKP